MSWLVVVLPLKEGARERALALLSDGPPFPLEETRYERHNVFVTHREVVFVFEAPGANATLSLPGEDPALWKVADAWSELAEAPRVAQEGFSWTRSLESADLSFDPTPGPGNSEGGDLFVPGESGRQGNRPACPALRSETWQAAASARRRRSATGRRWIVLRCRRRSGDGQ